MAPPSNDTVFVRNVSILAEIGLDSWGRSKAQPALISVRVSFSIEKAGVSDNIEDCMDYRKIYKAITSLNIQKFSSLLELTKKVSTDVLSAVDGERIETTVVLPKGLLQSEGVSIEMVMRQSTTDTSALPLEKCDLLVHKLIIPCVIGIGAHERPVKQPVVVDLKLNSDNHKGVGFRLSNPLADFNLIFQKFEKSEYLTLEALVTAMARFVLLEMNTGLRKVTVSAYKPAVFAAAEGPGVEITRTIDFFNR